MARGVAPGAGDTRQQILREALQAFAEKGYDGAATREIAARAGVNHGLIPYYFGSKEKLWQEAVDLVFGEMRAGLDALQTGASDETHRQRADRLVREHVRFVARRPEFVRLMHDEGKRRGPRMRWIVDRHVKPLYAALTELLTRAGGAGAPTDGIAPVHVFYVLAGASGVLFHQAEECRRVAGVDPFDPAVVEAHAEAVARLLLGPDPDAA